VETADILERWVQHSEALNPNIVHPQKHIYASEASAENVELGTTSGNTLMFSKMHSV
jgi:hypothetical protein